jgi:hypothetical protein
MELPRRDSPESSGYADPVYRETSRRLRKRCPTGTSDFAYFREWERELNIYDG